MRGGNTPRAAPDVGARLPDGWQSLVHPEWLEAWAPRPLALSGGDTWIVEAGTGPTLLLLPPLPGYKEAFVGVFGLLARHFRVVTVDLRARFEGRPTWTALLEDVDRVIESIGAAPVILAGHSLGGALAQQWALRHPDRVSRLVLSSTFARVGSVTGHGWKRYLEQPAVLAGQRWLPGPWARRLARNQAARGAWVYDSRCDERVLDFVRFGIRAVPIDLARQSLRLVWTHDSREGLGALQTPTLLLVGERETAWARRAEEELARLLPHAERRVIPAVAHLHPLSHPAGFVTAITEWV